MYIRSIPPDHPEILDLIHALDAYQNTLYPSESNHLDSADTLKQTNVIMAGALDADNHIMGMGAVKFMNGYGEIKRMFVPKAHRKKGVAQKILQALEHYTMAKQLSRLRLETGIHQQAAIGLYRAEGFIRTGPFGDYSDDPLSVFMEKDLASFSNALFISPYTRKDQAQVIGLWQACELTVAWNTPDKDILRKMDDSPDLFFLARLKDQVIGTCMAGYEGHRGSVNYLGVASEFRNLGVAQKLIQRVESALADRGCPKINLMVRKSNTKMIGFYNNLGYDEDQVLVLSKRLIPDD